MDTRKDKISNEGVGDKVRAEPIVHGDTKRNIWCFISYPPLNI